MTTIANSPRAPPTTAYVSVASPLLLSMLPRVTAVDEESFLDKVRVDVVLVAFESVVVADEIFVAVVVRR
jgi:hypothetical protein